MLISTSFAYITNGGKLGPDSNRIATETLQPEDSITASSAGGKTRGKKKHFKRISGEASEGFLKTAKSAVTLQKPMEIPLQEPAHYS